MVTIRQVAALAGVSPATVSRVMNGTARVDEAKRKRVLDAIEQTGFQPNELARALFKNTSKIIGLIVPDIQNPFFSELAHAIEQESFKRGCRLLLCNSSNDAQKEQMNINMLNMVKADGLILITNSKHSGELTLTCNFPVVVLDRLLDSVGGICSIESNHYKGGRVATQYLYDCGCRNIVCMRGPQEFSSGLLRFRGHSDVCRELGLTEQHIDCAYTFEAGLEAAETLLQRFPKVDGIAAANDMVAISTYKVLRNHGFKVPEDIQIIGFDDVSFSSLVSPEITTIRQPVKEMGRKAVEIICSQGEQVSVEKEYIYEIELIERETTQKKA